MLRTTQFLTALVFIAFTATSSFADDPETPAPDPGTDSAPVADPAPVEEPAPGPYEQPAPVPVDTVKLGSDIEVKPTGQYRARLEGNTNKDTVDGRKQVNVSHRARLGVAATLGGKHKAVLQVQDVRTWGEETDTLNDFAADGLDMHQAYVDINEGPLTFRLGRQEMIYDGQRLIGAVGWTNQGRSFDALRIMWKGHGANAHLLYSKVKEGPSTDIDLVGVWANYTKLDAVKPSFIFLLDRNDELDRTRATTGIYAKGGVSGIKYEAEGYLQFGTQGSQDILAFLLAGRVGYEVPVSIKPTIWVWAEYLSGTSSDSATADIKAFDTLFATNHKFYGFMDFFLGIPSVGTGTGGAGLIDLGGRIKASPMKGITAMLDFHHFRTAQDTASSTGETMTLGNEIDLTAKAKVNQFFSLVGGAGIMIPSEGLGCLRAASCSDPENDYFGYLMADVKY